jgi:hypothetical protein
MLSHALTIIKNELSKHLADNYGPEYSQVRLGNMAEGFLQISNDGSTNRDMLCLSMVNIEEEKTLKNLSNHVSNNTTLKVEYENPPIYLNFLILLSATYTDYTNALLVLSRALRFFQSKKVFTQNNVDPGSLTTSAPLNALDQLESFKIILDLYSPNLEEINHLWATLGGKQYPFVLYILRVLGLKFKAVRSEGRLVTEVLSGFSHKKAEAG